MSPLYYAVNSEELLVATDVRTIIGNWSSVELDWPAITNCIALGHFLGESTGFVGLKELVRGQKLKWTPTEGLTTHRIPLEVPAEIQVDLPSCYEQYDRLVRDALQEIAPHSCALGLSGGRDSRHILLACLALGGPPKTLVTSHHYLSSLSAKDVAIARLIADRCGLPIAEVYPLPDRIAAERRKNELIDARATAHSWGLGLREALAPEPILLDGMNGGILFGRAGLMRELPTVRPSSSEIEKIVVDRVFGRQRRWIEEMLPDYVSADKAIEDGEVDFAASLRRHHNFPNPLQSFLYAEHVAKDTRCFIYGMMTNRTVCTPLNSPALVAFALSLPWSISCNGSFQTKALRHCYPDFRDLPFVEEITLKPDEFVDAGLERASLNAWSADDQFLLQTSAGRKIRRGERLPLRDIQVQMLLSQLVHQQW